MYTSHFAYYSDKPLKLSTHYHDCHEILYILKGEIEICVNGVYKTVSAGNLVIFSRYENHSIRVLSPEYERYVLQIAPQTGGNHKLYALLANRPEGFQNVLCAADNPDAFERLFLQISLESTKQSPMHRDMMDLMVQELLILLYRRIPTLPISLEDDTFSHIFDLQHRFESDCSPSYMLEDLAREYNISPSSLSHQFKKVTGVSVMEYLLACRMAQAKKYLTETTLSISEIVDLCGFSDGSNFSRTFKKYNGMSPSTFRINYKS